MVVSTSVVGWDNKTYVSDGLGFIFDGFSRRNCIFYCCAWILEIIIKNKNILPSIRYKYNLTIANLRIHKKLIAVSVLRRLQSLPCLRTN
jgi:hypothetical protein